MKKIILIMTVCIYAYGSLSAQEILMIGGEIITTDQAPWVGYLKRAGGACTSVYIGDGWVLTAAHCVDQGVKAEDVMIEFQVNNICVARSNKFSYEVTEIHIYPNYVPYKENSFVKQMCYDMALLKLEREPDVPAIDYGPYINGEDGIAYGYGRNENNIESCELRKGNLGLPSELFNNVYNCGQMLYFDKGEAFAVQGDSGGPVVMYTGLNNQPTLIGISSHAIINVSSSYTSVFPYTHWIESTKAGEPYVTHYPHIDPYISSALGKLTVKVLIEATYLTLAYYAYQRISNNGRTNLPNGQNTRATRAREIRYQRIPCENSEIEMQPTDYFPTK